MSCNNGSESATDEPTAEKVRRLSIEEVPIIRETTVTCVDQNVTKTSPSKASTPSTSRQKTDFEPLFQNYLKSFKDKMTALNAKESTIKELSDKFNDIYVKTMTNNKSFLEGQQFGKMIKVFTDEITAMSSEEAVVRHHNDLTIELFRFSQKPIKSAVNNVKNKVQKIKRLTETLKKLQRQVYTAENEELDMDALDKESGFTDLPKLYKRINDVWTKREELLRRSTNTGRKMFKKYRCDSTTHPEINKCVENLFNSHLKRIKNKTTKGYIDETFTFIDVRKAILDVINDKQLAVMDTEAMIQTIYRDLLNEKRTRRQLDSEELFETLETLDDLKPETFAKEEEDPTLELKLAKNKQFGDKRMQELFEKFAKEDRTKNGESILKEGLSEWDLSVDNNNENNEEYDSLDIKDGDLEEEEEEEDGDESDDEIQLLETSIPEFSTTEETTASAVSPSKPTTITSCEPTATATTSAEPTATETTAQNTAPVINNNIKCETKPTATITAPTPPITAQKATFFCEADTITIDDDDEEEYNDDYEDDDIVILN